MAAATNIGLLTRFGRKEKGLLGRSGMWGGGWQPHCSLSGTQSTVRDMRLEEDKGNHG